MPTKLIGADDFTSAGGSSDYFRLCRFQAVKTGTITELRYKSGASGNVKIALYADTAGEPNALITAMNTGQAVVNGWNTLNFTPTPVVKDVWYWLAVNFDTSYAHHLRVAANPYKYKEATYSGFTFPNPAGTGFTSGNYEAAMAGWGSWLVELTETVTFTDSLPKKVTKMLTETVGFTDILSKIRMKTLTEVVTFTDSLIRRATKVLTETVTFADTMELRRWLTPTRIQGRTREQAATRNEPATREET